MSEGGKEVTLLFEQFLKIKKLNEEIKQNNDGSNDMIDILNNVSEILGEFVFDKDNNYLEIDVFYQDQFKTRYKSFREKEKQRLDEVILKVNDLNIQMREIRNKFDQKIMSIVNKIKAIQSNDNSQKLADYQNRLNVEYKEKTDMVSLAYENFDKQLAEELKKLTSSYKEKINNIEDENSQLQMELQSQVHDKHNSKKDTQEKFENEDKRIATLLENLSKENQLKKAELEKKKNELNRKIFDVKYDINHQHELNIDHLKRLEIEYKEDHQKILNEKQDKLNELDGNISQLHHDIDELKQQIDIIESDSNNEINKMQQKISKKIEKKAGHMDERLNMMETAIFNQYQPRVTEIDNQIQEVVLVKDKIEAENRKKLNEQNISLNNDLIKFKNKQKEEIGQIKQQIRMKKKELEAFINNKNNNIELEKIKVQQKMGHVKQEIDAKTQGIMLEIVEIMKQFDEQESILEELKKKSIEDSNVRRMRLINQIKEQHEERKREIIKSFDKLTNQKADEEFSIIEVNENKKHEFDIKDIQERIQESKEKMSVLQKKIDGFLAISEERMRRIKESIPNFLDENNIMTPFGVLDEIEKRKRMVCIEEEDAKKNLEELQADFQRRMKIVEDNFHKGEKHIMIEEQSITLKHSKLKTNITKQKDKLYELNNIAESKSKEANYFEQSYEEEKNKYERKTRDIYEENIENIKRPTLDFESKMEQLKSHFEETMNDLKKQLEIANKNTERIMRAKSLEREEKIEALKDEMIIKHDELMEDLMNQHDEMIIMLEDKLENTKKSGVEEKENIEENYNQTIIDNETNYNQTIENLNQEKEKLDEESTVLIKQVDEERHKECPICSQKKKIIRMMLSKKENLSKNHQILIEEMFKNDEMMNEIFLSTDREIERPPVIISETTANSPLITSRKAQLNLSMPKRPSTTIGLEKLKSLNKNSHDFPNSKLKVFTPVTKTRTVGISPTLIPPSQRKYHRSTPK